MIQMTMSTDLGRRPRRAAARRRPEFRLWLPMLLIWLLLAPLLILLSPLLILGLAMAGLKPFRALAALLGLLAAVGGTRIEVDSPDGLIDIHLI
jgi:hypothetical protein